MVNNNVMVNNNFFPFADININYFNTKCHVGLEHAFRAYVEERMKLYERGKTKRTVLLWLLASTL